VILLPVAYLLSTTSKVAGSNQHRLTAQSLAASWLEQERTAAGQSATSPPSAWIQPPTGTGSGAWPSGPSAQQVGGFPYQVYVAGGWCAYAGAGVAWNNGAASTTSPSFAAPPLTYFIAVKVKWGPDASNPNLIGDNDGAVVEYSSVQSQSGWIVPVGSPATNESVLTLTTTVGIPGYCPLGLK